jgi:hypothetical protein
LPPCLVRNVLSKPLQKKAPKTAVLPTACGELQLPILLFAKRWRTRAAQKIRLGDADFPFPAPTDFKPGSAPLQRGELSWPEINPIECKMKVVDPHFDINIVQPLEENAIQEIYEELKGIKPVRLKGPRIAVMPHPLENRMQMIVPEIGEIPDCNGLLEEWYQE